jgi:hypothetical protein
MDKIAEKLDGINRTLEKMLAIMDKPKSKFVQVLEIFGLSVGALGILYVADLVRSWILGG